MASAEKGAGFTYNFGSGPFALTSNSPGPSLRLAPMPVVPSRITPGGIELTGSVSWANVWANERLFLFDYEMLDGHLSVSYGINKRWLVSLAFTQRTFFGGSMDNFIIDFHDIFGIDQDGRNDAPKNSSTLLLLDGNGNIVNDLGSADRLNNSSVALTTSYILCPGNRILPAISLSAVVSYGLETPFGDDDPVDITVGLGISKRWSTRWISYHTLNHTHYGQTDMPGLAFEDTGFYTTHTFAWEKNPSLSFLIQYMYHEGVIKDLGSLSDASHELALGFKWRHSRKGAFELGIIENIIDYANSPDFGIHAAYKRTFN